MSWFCPRCHEHGMRVVDERNALKAKLAEAEKARDDARTCEIAATEVMREALVCQGKVEAQAVALLAELEALRELETIVRSARAVVLDSNTDEPPFRLNRSFEHLDEVRKKNTP